MEQSVHTKPTPVAAWRRWSETLLLAAVGVATFAMYATHNPASDLSVVWLVLIPVLSGAQHGTSFGFVSAGAICAVGLQASAAHASLGALGSLVTQGWGLVFAGVG